jgi:hypothetical protein
MPQVPALDRVPRPQIDARGVLAGMQELGNASQRRAVDERPFVEAAGAGDEAIGKALRATGSVLGALSHKVREVNAHQARVELDTAMDDAAEQSQAHQQANPHEPGSWGKFFHGLATGVMHLFKTDHRITGPQREQTAARVTTWARQKTIETDTAGIKQNLLNASNVVLARSTRLAEQGKVEQSEQDLEDGNRAGLFLKPVFDAQLAKVHTIGAHRDAGNALAKVTEGGAPLEVGEKMLTESRYIPKEQKERAISVLRFGHGKWQDERQLASDLQQDATGTLKKLQSIVVYPRIQGEARADAIRRGQILQEVAGQRELRTAIDNIALLPPDKLRTATINDLGVAWHDASAFHQSVANGVLERHRSADPRPAQIEQRNAMAQAAGYDRRNDPQGIVGQRIEAHAGTLPDEDASKVMKRLQDARENKGVHPIVASAVATLHDWTQGSRRILGSYEVQATGKDGKPLWVQQPDQYMQVIPGEQNQVTRLLGQGKWNITSPQMVKVVRVPAEVMAVDKEKLTEVQRKAEEIREKLDEAAWKGEIKSSKDAKKMLSQLLVDYGANLNESAAAPGALSNARLGYRAANQKALRILDQHAASKRP